MARFAWQAWHKLTSTVVLRGRRGTHGIGWRAWTGLVARDARDAAALWHNLFGFSLSVVDKVLQLWQRRETEKNVEECSSRATGGIVFLISSV